MDDQTAWVQFASAALTYQIDDGERRPQVVAMECGAMANHMLAEYRKRFPNPLANIKSNELKVGTLGVNDSPVLKLHNPPRDDFDRMVHGAVKQALDKVPSQFDNQKALDPPESMPREIDILEQFNGTYDPPRSDNGPWNDEWKKEQADKRAQALTDMIRADEEMGAFDLPNATVWDTNELARSPSKTKLERITDKLTAEGFDERDMFLRGKPEPTLSETPQPPAEPSDAKPYLTTDKAAQRIGSAVAGVLARLRERPTPTELAGVLPTKPSREWPGHFGQGGVQPTKPAADLGPPPPKK